MNVTPEMIEAAALATSTAPVSVPAGWKLVPVEPTEEMHNAARDWSVKKYGIGVGRDGSDGCYRAMLAAAPQPPMTEVEPVALEEVSQQFRYWIDSAGKWSNWINDPVTYPWAHEAEDGKVEFRKLFAASTTPPASLREENERLKAELGAVAGHLDCDAIDSDAILHVIREIEADLDIAKSRAAAAEAERYELAYAITGGEDAPGLLDSVPVSELVKIARDNVIRHREDIDRATAAEQRLAVVEEENDKTKGDLLKAVAALKDIKAAREYDAYWIAEAALVGLGVIKGGEA